MLEPKTRSIGAGFRDRWLDVLASIYIYNEYRGYTSLDRVLAAVRELCPDEPEFIAQIAQHRAEERKHYVMFRRWFERQGRMPLLVSTGFGHIDRFIESVFGCSIDNLDAAGVTADKAAFERLCRVIMLTEQRGLAQVEVLLKNRIVRSDPVMTRIFRIIHQDEPGHFLPYQHWLERHGHAAATWQERAADWSIHKVLMLGKLPALFLDAGAPRLTRWPDADEGCPAAPVR